MTLLAAIVLASAKLDDCDLVALELRIDRRGDFGAFDIRGADFHVSAIADHQNLVEGQGLGVFGDVLELKIKAGAGFNSVLMRTVFNDRVQGKSSKMPKREIDWPSANSSKIRKPRIFAKSCGFVKTPCESFGVAVNY